MAVSSGAALELSFEHDPPLKGERHQDLESFMNFLNNWFTYVVTSAGASNAPD